MITKVLVGAAIAAAAAGGLAAPASADPTLFNVLSCSCAPSVDGGGVPAADQMNRGIQTALTDLRDIHNQQ